MKVLFVTSSHPIGDFKGGGITTYSAEVVRCFKNNHEISVVVCNPHLSGIDIPGIKTYHIHPYSESFPCAQKLISIVKENEPEIIINSNVDLFSLVLPYLPNEIKVISICHSQGSLETETACMHHKYVDMIVALSKYAKEHIIKRFNINPDKIVVIPNFVAGLENAETLIESKKRAKVPTIVYAGGGTGTKSPDLIAKILKRLLKTDLDFHFIWVGRTLPPLHSLSIFNDIRSLFPNDRRVLFTGQVPYTEAQRLISNANIYLLPSRREGCPISLLEAMRTGAIPIVAEYKISNREIVQDGYNGYIINHRDVERYVEVIYDIIKNNSKMGNLYDNSYAYFCDNLSFPVWERKMDELLNVKNSHNPRNKTINERAFLHDKNILKILLKMRKLQTFTKETLPAYLSINMQYLINHY